MPPFCELLFCREWDMSVDSAENNNVETSVVDGIVTSVVNIDTIGTFELEHDLLFEADNVSATLTGPPGAYILCSSVSYS